MVGLPGGGKNGLRVHIFLSINLNILFTFTIITMQNTSQDFVRMPVDESKPMVPTAIIPSSTKQLSSSSSSGISDFFVFPGSINSVGYDHKGFPSTLHDLKPTTKWVSIHKNTPFSGTVSGEWNDSKYPSQTSTNYRAKFLFGGSNQ